MTNIPLTVPVKVSVQNLTYKVNVSTAIQVVRADPYEGDYTVTPSLTEQILETNGKVMEDDVTVQAVPQGSATTPATTITRNPNFIFDQGTGIVTASYKETRQITPEVVKGYVTAGTAGAVTVTGKSTLQLDTQGVQTIHPSTEDQTIDRFKFLTGVQTIKAVTVSGLTADKVLQGNVVRIGDELDPEHIMRVEGTAVVPSGTKQIAITKNGTVTEDVTRYENAEITTNVPASEVDKGTKSIATNGTHNVVGYANAQVAVPASEVDVGTKEITSNGTHDVVGYASADVNVPNSYSASDEGKVVSNGALVAQTSDTVTANDTYDTTLINSLTVNVSGGGGISVDDIATNTAPSGAITLGNSVTSIGDYALAGKPITSITAPSVTSLGSMSLQNTQITNIDDTNFPSLGVSSQYSVYLRISALQHITLSGQKITLSSGSGALRDNANLVSAEFPHCAKNVSASAVSMGASCFNGCKKLKLVDMGSCGSIGNSGFNNCKALTTIIMRKTSLVTLVNTNALTSGTPFKSGGTGGDIYIPKSLYDHLGDGTSSDYKSATNWSTVDGYGTITWHAIEGSIYEL